MADRIEDRAPFRAIGWLAVAALGALIIGSGGLDALHINEYTQRWLGACLKVGTGAWGGYRISRDVARIDPSASGTGFATLHLARAIIISACILAVCLAV